MAAAKPDAPRAVDLPIEVQQVGALLIAIDLLIDTCVLRSCLILANRLRVERRDVVHRIMSHGRRGR
jgi:hypothetical protein